MTEPELIWRLFKDADAIRPEVYAAIVEYMGLEAMMANQWEQAWPLMAAYWLDQTL